MEPGFDKDTLFNPVGSHEQAVAEKLSGVFGDRRSDGAPCCEATYVQGVKEGIGRMFHGGGKCYAVETWRNGELDGPTRIYYENGAIQAELNYKGGFLDGVCQEYFPGGQVESVTTWVSGEREGECTVYSEDGLVVSTVVFRDDVPEA